MISKENPLIPKNPGGPLKVIVIGRLSKPKPTEDETQRTIESSLKSAQEYLAAIYKGAVECRCLGEQISGMVVERVAIMETYELVQTGEWDLVLVEELRCVYRNPRFQYAFVQNLVDLDQRFISVADNLDTGDENWETQMAVAAVRHGLVVPDTRRRMRRTAKYVFHGGGMVLKVRFGYRKLTKEEAKSGAFGPPGLREAKVPEATPVWQEIRRRLIETQIPTAVVDWLNEQGIQPGPYVELGKWTVANLKGAACDPKLHGTRLFRRVICTRIFGTGCFKRQPNPEPEKSYVPELAHMTLDEQTSMLAAVGWELDWGNRVVNWPSPRRGVPRYKPCGPDTLRSVLHARGE